MISHSKRNFHNIHIVIIFSFRPIINNKFEEKTCGEGPSLTIMFEDDRHLQALILSIRVSKNHRNRVMSLHLAG